MPLSRKPHLTFSADFKSQRDAMVFAYKLATDALRSPEGEPLIRETAIRMVRNCKSRDDMCELQAVFDAIRDGDRGVPGFEHGVKYMTDPEIWSAGGKEVMDHYTSPDRLIEQCQRGVCAEDCDGMGASLLIALLMSLGFKCAACIFKPADSTVYEHIYTLVGYPKLDPDKIIALDPTVSNDMGWEATGGEHLAATFDPDLKKLIAGRYR